ncbi:MAG: alkaline phosphatase family protein, partial [Thermoplasmatota archaeon]
MFERTSPALSGLFLPDDAEPHVAGTCTLKDWNPAHDPVGAANLPAGARYQRYGVDNYDCAGSVFAPDHVEFAQFPQPANFPQVPIPQLGSDGRLDPFAGARSTTSAYVPPFTHFVIVMRENHVFDDYLGDCKSFNSSCDGQNQTTNHVSSVPRLHDLAKKYSLFDAYSSGVAPPSGPNHWYLFAAAVMTQAQQGYYPPHGTMFDRYLNSSDKVTFVTAGDIYWEVAANNGWMYNKSKPGGAGPDALPVWRPNSSIREELDYNNYTKYKINDDDTLIRNDYEHFVNHSGLPTYSFIELFNDHPGTYQDI